MFTGTILNFILFLVVIAIGTAVSVSIRQNLYSKPTPFYVFGVFTGTVLFTALLIFIIYRLILHQETTAFLSDAGSVMIAMAAVLTGLCLRLLVLACYRRNRKEDIYHHIPAFLPVFEFLILLILISGIFNTLFRGGEGTGISYSHLLSFVAIFLTACLMILLLLRHAQMMADLQQLEEAERLSELEHTHYAAVESRRQDLNRIRNDYNRQLTSIRSLLADNDRIQAIQLLNDLSIRIAATSETPFCAIPVINAILTEKQEICDGQNISFSADLHLPDNLPVKSLDLCMALGNLMDNAIFACSCMPESAAISAGIRLYGEVVQGYLVLKCENTIEPQDSISTISMSGSKVNNISSVKNEQNNETGFMPDNTAGNDRKHTAQNPIRHKGYGLKILNDIAARYSGNFYTEINENIFTAQLSLRAACRKSSVMCRNQEEDKC